MKHVMLGLLAGGEQHGYELKRLYDLRFPAARPLASAQVYSTLARLARDGMVVAGEPERVGGPDRTSYALTPQGQEEFVAWLQEVEPPSPFVANPLAVKVTLFLLTAGADGARGYLRRQREAHMRRMREYTQVKTDPAGSLAMVLEADYAIEHLDADLRWMGSALARVELLEKEITS
ncbi:PadR family transcriptional regulator [Kineosporia succinea]